MSYLFYKVLHLLGVMLLFFALGGYAMSPTGEGASKRGRLVLGFAHGFGVLLLLVAGFGLLAKLGIMGNVPLWAWLKVGLWLALAAAPVLIRRTPASLRLAWVALPFVGAVAGWLAIYKAIG